MNRPRRVIACLSIGLLTIVAAACGDDSATAPPLTTTTTATTRPAATSTVPVAPTTTPAPTTTAPPVTTVPVETRLVPVFFVKAGRLAPLPRAVPTPLTVSGLAQAVVGGVRGDEAAAGYATLVPTGSTLRGATLSGTRATVDVSAAFTSGGGSLSMRGRVAQIVYTLHRSLGVTAVTFLVDGQAVTSIGGEGLIVTDVKPTEFDDLLPNVITESPLRNQTLGPSFAFTGQANVFEGTVNYEVLAADGRTLATGFATGAMGFWGEFRATVGVSVAALTNATFVVFTVSAKDGSRLDVDPIPIVIDPRSR